MSEEKNLTVVDNPTVAPWGDRQEIAALGRRIRVMLPGGEKLTDTQAMALAQYSVLTNANPFRGEVYAMVNPKGEMTLVDGYKLLVRWAKKKADYIDAYRQMTVDELKAEGQPQDAIGYRCFILKKADMSIVKDFRGMGFEPQQAFEMVAACATGVVLPEDMYSKKYNKPIDPPKGWTWHDVARKRALKNALNLSHGMPSPQELAAVSWQVNGQQTTIEDWADIPPDLPPAARERWAEMSAHTRQDQAAREQMTPEERKAEFEQNVTLLRGEQENGID